MKKIEISKKDLKNNIKIIKDIVIGEEKDDKGNKTQIIAVVKGNGYGLGLIEYTSFLIDNGVDFFAVATVEEAVKLREAGIKDEILVLGIVFPEEMDIADKNSIQITVGNSYRSLIDIVLRNNNC